MSTTHQAIAYCYFRNCELSIFKFEESVPYKMFCTAYARDAFFAVIFDDAGQSITVKFEKDKSGQRIQRCYLRNYPHFLPYESDNLMHKH